MQREDAEYFYRRAEVETEHAQNATDPKVVAAHYQLAEAYLERVSSIASGKDPGGRPGNAPVQHASLEEDAPLLSQPLNSAALVHSLTVSSGDQNSR
jgi:hypothetical protein